MVRQLYQKYLLPFDEYRAKRDSSVAAKLADPASSSMTTFDKIVAAASGNEDIDVLGAVAVLMDAPASETHPSKRFKLDAAAVRRILSCMRP